VRVVESEAFDRSYTDVSGNLSGNPLPHAQAGGYLPANRPC